MQNPAEMLLLPRNVLELTKAVHPPEFVFGNGRSDRIFHQRKSLESLEIKSEAVFFFGNLRLFARLAARSARPSALWAAQFGAFRQSKSRAKPHRLI